MRTPARIAEQLIESSGGNNRGRSSRRRTKRERYHDWNALHMRQNRMTRAILGCGTALVVLNFAMGGIGAIALQAPP